MADKDSITSFASLVAHQLKSPVAAASTLLKTVLGEYAGPLTPKQKDMLERVDGRIEEALATSKRMLAVVRPESMIGDEDARCDLSDVVRRCQSRYDEESAARGIKLTTDISSAAASVRGDEAGITETLNALVSNALKYTPDNGSVAVSLVVDESKRLAVVSVSDSGIGVPKESMEKIFEPFNRSSSAQKSSRPGVGLGLAFVKSVVSALGGTINVGKSETLGGACFTVSLPLAEDAGRMEHEAMRVVIVGGVAAGPKVASKILRLKPDADVTIIEKGEFMSYAGCGLPYYISGVVKEQKQLWTTSVGVERDPVFFQNIKHVNVRSGCEVIEIDRDGKRVRIREKKSSEEEWFDYDTLVLATGAKAPVLDVPGASLSNIFTLHGVRDAEGIKSFLSSKKASDVVIVGGGLLGVDVTEALVGRGCRVTIIQRRSRVLEGLFDVEMALLVERKLESKGVRILTEASVESYLSEDGVSVSGVMVNGKEHVADMVVLAIGVEPEVALAKNARLEIGETGAIKVDRHLRTSDPNIYAVGDCAETIDLAKGGVAVHAPFGTVANKMGRVAAINICGGSEIYPGVWGSTVSKIFDYCVARTGVTESYAVKNGFDVVCAWVPAPDREHFMPEVKWLNLKLIVDAGSRRILGAQCVGTGLGLHKINVVASAMAGGLTVDDLSTLDFCYAPSYALAMDILSTAANIVKNKLNGDMVGVSSLGVREKLLRKEAVLLLDVRNYHEYQKERLAGSTHIPLGALRGRLEELPRDCEIIVFDSVSLRGYEAALTLRSEGFKDVKVLDGGIDMWPFDKIEGIQ